MICWEVTSFRIYNRKGRKWGKGHRKTAKDNFALTVGTAQFQNLVVAGTYEAVSGGRGSKGPSRDESGWPLFPHRRHRDLNGWNEMWEEKGGETEMSALTVSDCDRKIDKHEKHKEDAL